MDKKHKAILIGVGAFAVVYMWRKGAGALPVQRIEETVADPIYFEYDSSAITAEGQARLRELANLLNQGRWRKVVLTGHTDSAGDPGYNHELGLRRAASVAGFLEMSGLQKPPGAEVLVRSAGSSQPFAGNDTAAGRALNRRVEIEIVP